MKTDNRVKRFIDDTFSVDESKGDTLLTLQKIILSIYPDAQKEIKYGGLVFNLDTELICGIFIKQKHKVTWTKENTETIWLAIHY